MFMSFWLILVCVGYFLYSSYSDKCKKKALWWKHADETHYVPDSFKLGQRGIEIKLAKKPKANRSSRNTIFLHQGSIRSNNVKRSLDQELSAEGKKKKQE